MRVGDINLPQASMEVYMIDAKILEKLHNVSLVYYPLFPGYGEVRGMQDFKH